MNEKDYNALLDMFVSDGWKLFAEEKTEQEKYATQGAVDGALTGDQWQYLRGWLHGLRAVLGYEDFVRLSYEAQKEDDDADL